MSALDKHIEQLSKGIEPDDEFPKNESSWEELYEFGRLRVAELAVLRARVEQLERIEQAAKVYFELTKGLADFAHIDTEALAAALAKGKTE